MSTELNKGFLKGHNNNNDDDDNNYNNNAFQLMMS